MYEIIEDFDRYDDTFLNTLFINDYIIIDIIIILLMGLCIYKIIGYLNCNNWKD